MINTCTLEQKYCHFDWILLAIPDLRSSHFETRDENISVLVTVMSRTSLMKVCRVSNETTQDAIIMNLLTLNGNFLLNSEAFIGGNAIQVINVYIGFYGVWGGRDSRWLIWFLFHSIDHTRYLYAWVYPSQYFYLPEYTTVINFTWSHIDHWTSHWLHQSIHWLNSLTHLTCILLSTFT